MVYRQLTLGGTTPQTIAGLIASSATAQDAASAIAAIPGQGNYIAFPSDEQDTFQHIGLGGWAIIQSGQAARINMRATCAALVVQSESGVFAHHASNGVLSDDIIAILRSIAQQDQAAAAVYVLPETSYIQAYATDIDVLCQQCGFNPANVAIATKPSGQRTVFVSVDGSGSISFQ